MPDERWNVDVTELTFTFVAALRALVPHLDQAWVTWSPPQARYDDFDRVAEALFASFVLSPAAYDERFEGLALDDFRPFGFDGDTGRWRAQLEVAHPEFGQMGPLIDLDTRDEPFDQVVVNHDVSRVAVAEVVFGFTREGGEFIRYLAVEP